MRLYQTAWVPRFPERRGHGAALPVAVWLAAAAALAAPGCAAAADQSAKLGPAKATVVAFLDAIKRGDDAAARGLLTGVARAKTQELGISVAPPVQDSATFEVRECQLVGDAEDLAHVATLWTDVDSDGFKSSENVIWVVRLDPEGWRVVGMAMVVFDDLPPLLLNFEDPEDMLRKQQLVAQELDKRAKQAAAAAPAQGVAGQAGVGNPAPRTARQIPLAPQPAARQ